MQHVMLWSGDFSLEGKTKGPKIKAEGRDRGGVLGEGQQATSPPTGGSGERCELPQRSLGLELRPPKGFPLFSALRMTSADTVVDYRAAIGGKTPVPPLLCTPMTTAQENLIKQYKIRPLHLLLCLPNCNADVVIYIRHDFKCRR